MPAQPAVSSKALYDLSLREIFFTLFISTVMTTITGALFITVFVAVAAFLPTYDVFEVLGAAFLIGMLALWVGGIVVSMTTLFAALPVAIFFFNLARDRTLLILGSLTGFLLGIYLTLLWSRGHSFESFFVLVIAGTFYGWCYGFYCCAIRRRLFQRRSGGPQEATPH